MSQTPYPQGKPPQSQIPASHNPYQQPPFGGGPPQKTNNTKVVLIILGIVGGVIVLSVLICGIFGYLAVRNVQEGFAGMMEEVIKTAEARQEAEEKYWVETYRDHEAVKEKIGTITSHERITDFSSTEGTELLQRIKITGDKGSGEIVVEEKFDFDPEKMDEDTGDFQFGESEITAYLVVDGERTLIDDDASIETNDFVFDYTYEGDELEGAVESSDSLDPE